MYKVLIVDDETPALRYLQTIVEKYAPSYEIAGCCTSGEEALARLQKEHIDLLLTDISMPAMDGITLSMEARQMQPDIHIKLVEALCDKEIGVIRDSFLQSSKSFKHVTPPYQLRSI